MRHIQIEILDRELVGGQRFPSHLFQRFDRHLEGLIAFHLHVLEPLGQHLLGRGDARSAARHADQVPEVPVRMQMRREDPAFPLTGAQHHRARAVPEQDTGAAVRPIHQHRHHLGADDQDVPGSGLDEGIAHPQGIHEPATGRREVTGGRPHRAQPLLDQTGGGRQRRVAGAGGHQNQIEIGGSHAGRLQGALGRPRSQIGAGFARSGDATLADSGSFEDPGVRRRHHPLEFGIGEDTLRNVGPGPRNSASHSGASPLSARCCSARLSSMSRWISSLSRLSARPLARRMAFLIALADERP